MPQSKFPYLRQRRANKRDLAFVKLPDGRRRYLGPWGSKRSEEEYQRQLAELAASPPPPPPDRITVAEIIGRYLEHADRYYRRTDGTPTGTAENVRMFTKPLLKLYGSKRATRFDLRALKTFRDHGIRERDWSRSHANASVKVVQRIFRWATEEELLGVDAYQKLTPCIPLKKGRSPARETRPVRPVPEAHIEAVHARVSRQIRAMMDVQLLTGARSGEVVIMRTCDIDMTGPVWIYRPIFHKTDHLDGSREVYIGPRAQGILRPFLAGPVDRFLFRPIDAEHERLLRRSAARRTALSYGNVPGSNRKSQRKRQPGERYTPGTYRNAIRRACKAAGVPHWHPHQLRHNAGTSLRREFGIEVAKAVLGHRVLTATVVYAEQDAEKAVRAVEQIG